MQTASFLKRLLVAVGIVGITAWPTVRADQKGPEEKQAFGHFPLKVGLQWTYREKTTGQDFGGVVNKEQKTVFKITDQKKVQEGPAHVFAVSYEKDKQGLELWYVPTADGINLCQKKITVDGKEQEIKIAAPELFLKMPLKQGDKWDYGQFKAENKGEEEVKVDAGTFKCFKIVLTNTRPNPIGICNVIGNPNEITLWFAGGTGLVKQTWQTHWGAGPRGGTITNSRELLAFDKGDGAEKKQK